KKDVVLGYVREVASLGVAEITLCDTVGLGNPRQVADMVSSCQVAFPSISFGCHFHNTRGLGIANTLAAYENGIRCFDAALGGLGGCPFAPGASGNVATEEVAFMFTEMGIDIGVDVARLLETARFLREIAPSAPMASALMEAGLPQPLGPISISEKTP
ncbi:MAG: hypothetical protein PHY31_04365, partial [Smithellaceae bacterium]|nr:hypothetical protein [Smithellaceae bacterium]